MRVLFAITRGEVGGAQEHVKILARALVDDGNPVALLVDETSALASAAGEMGADVIDWPSVRRAVSPLADVRARHELVRATRRWRPEVLHCHSSKAGVLGVATLASPDGVTVFTCHHAPFGPRRQWSHRLVARPVEQLALPRFDGIITVGVRDLPMLRRLAPRVPIRHVPNAVPAPAVAASTGPLRPVALWVARMARPKDPVLAVRAWERVVRSVPDARLLMCGTGPLEPAVQRALRRSPARSAVEVLGFVDDLRAVRARASLFLLASRVEGGTTMATLEAMADGLVPVVSDVGDASVLADEGRGVCVHGRRPQDLADAVVALLGDPARFDALRSAGLRYTAVERTPADVLRETVGFYRELSGGGRR